MTRILVSPHTRLAIATVALALLITPWTAHAATINFDQVIDGGTITDLGGGDYEGEDIIFNTITYVGTTVYCNDPTTGGQENCLLNFNTSTGDFDVTSDAGLFDLVGAIPGGTGPLTVLEGTIEDWGVLVGTIFGGVGVDSKHQALLDYFGITDTNFRFVNTEIFTDGFDRYGVAQVNDADIVNSVPEPGILALFGLGLLGVGRQLARRRRD